MPMPAPTGTSPAPATSMATVASTSCGAHDSGVSTRSGGIVDNAANLWINPGTQWHIQDPSVHDPFPFA